MRAPAAAVAVAVPGTALAAAGEPVGTAQAIVVTALAVVLAVMINYEALSWILRLIARSQRPHRIRIAGLVLATMAVHVIEIALFACAYLLLVGGDPHAGLAGGPVTGWSDYFYYSGVVYTTLGFGDLVPRPGLRLLTAVESVTGLVLITWSASVAFLEMQRIWTQRG